MFKKVFFMIIAILSFVPLLFASPPARIRHADRNKDGVVTVKEWRVEKKWVRRHDAKVNTWWERRADKDKDGIVDATELTSWKIIEKKHLDLNHNGIIEDVEIRRSWKYADSRVNTALEKKYDKNNDGWLQPAEARELLKDKYRIITTHGKAIVDTDIEYEYDINADGVIDKDEAEAIKEDLQ